MSEESISDICMSLFRYTLWLEWLVKIMQWVVMLIFYILDNWNTEGTAIQISPNLGVFR